MLNRITKATEGKRVRRLLRKNRISKKLALQNASRPRLVVFRSNRYLYAQLVSDSTGTTLAQANTKEKDFSNLKSKKNKEAATSLGKAIAQRILAQKIDQVVFDRNGYNYHGRIKALADGAREAGMKF